MRLIRLRLENYRRFREAEVEFPDGVIGIVGENGAGKSTLVEAIAFALYGTDVHQRRGGKDAVRWSGAARADPCRVEMRFEFSGQTYDVVRELRGANQVQHARLLVNGTPMAENARPVTSFLARDLNMALRAFHISVFARQKEVDLLVDSRLHERKALILRLMGLEDIDRAVTIARDRERLILASVEDLEREVLALPELRREVEELRERRRDEESRRIALEGAVRERRTALERAEAEVERLEALAREHHRLQLHLRDARGELGAAIEEIERIKRDLRSIERDRARIPDLKRAVSEFGEVDVRLREIEGLVVEARRRRDLERDLERKRRNEAHLRGRLEGRPDDEGYVREIGRAESDLTSAETALREVEDGLRRTAEAMATARERRRLCEEDLASVRRKLARIEALGPDSTCPECERPLGDHHAELVARYRRELGSLNERAAGYARKIDELERERVRSESARGEAHRAVEEARKRLEALRKERAEAARDREELERVVREIADLEGKIAGIPVVPLEEEEIQALRDRRERLLAMRDELRKVEGAVARRADLERDLGRARTRRRSAERELAALDVKIGELGFDESVLVTAKGEVKAARGALDKVERAFRDNEVGVRLIDAEIAARERSLGDLEERRRGLEERRHRANLLGRLQETFRGFRVHMIGRLREDLMLHGSEWLARFTDGRYSVIDIDEDYNIRVVEGREIHPIERYSGGEIDVIGLSLRMAISEILALRSGAPIRLVVLDEVFGSQDMSRRRAILTALGRMTERFDQVLLISHVEDVKDHLEHVITVEALDDGSSRVVME